MPSNLMVRAVSALILILTVIVGGPAWSTESADRQGHVQLAQAPQQPSITTYAYAEDPVKSYEKRIDALEEWKAKIERLPSLSGKFNIGLNALQFLYSHQDAHVAEGKSQDAFQIRRSEILMYGKINEYIPKWHTLMEFQSNGLTNNTPGCAPGTDCTNRTQNPSGTATSANYFREAYIDFRPFPNFAPELNFFRMGIFRLPLGIFTGTSGGIRDIISSPYVNGVGSGGGSKNGAAGAIDFIGERDYFVDFHGKLFNKLEYVAGVMNGNNFQSNGAGSNNGPKQMYTRERFYFTDISYVSFTTVQGESNNNNTYLNGRGKGRMDRYAVDFQYRSRILPGFMAQGEFWQGHDAANQTTVGTPAQGACLTQSICGGNGAPGVQRRTWYAYAKYFISSGFLQNYEPVVMYEQFDPNTSLSNDMYTRTIVGFNYYFENLPPKIQTKVSVNYEFRHHQGNGPGTAIANTDPFAQNVFLVQYQVRYQ